MFLVLDNSLNTGTLTVKNTGLPIRDGDAKTLVVRMLGTLPTLGMFQTEFPRILIEGDCGVSVIAMLDRVPSLGCPDFPKSFIDQLIFSTLPATISICFSESCIAGFSIAFGASGDIRVVIG